MITLALGAWIMLGIFLDSMAHNARTQDSLFSTAHLVVFSGTVAVTVWMLRGVIGPAGSGRRGLGAVPAGYESGLLAIVLFAVTLIADPLWHAVRGVEQGILALTSPSHAPFFVGVVLVLSCPFRAAWVRDPDLDSHAPSLKAFLPTVSSISLTMLFVGVTFMHVWPFVLDQQIVDGRVHEVFRDTLAAGGYPAAVLQEVVRRRFLSGIYLVNLMLFAPLLLMLLRWRLPPGAATIYMVVVTGTYYVPTALVAGLVTDGLIWFLRPSPRRLGAFRLFAATAPLVVWSLYLLRVHLMVGLSLPLEGWAGAIVWSGIGGLALSAVMVPPRPQTSPGEREEGQVIPEG